MRSVRHLVVPRKTGKSPGRKVKVGVLPAPFKRCHIDELCWLPQWPLT
jgi:hypothetical protein